MKATLGIWRQYWPRTDMALLPSIATYPRLKETDNA